jgi:predicted small metal-binding protein
VKRFACGDVVPSCGWVYQASDDADLMRAIADHVRRVHGIADLTPELLALVTEKVTSAS